MSKPNFSALMNKPIGEVKRPVLQPEGTYYGVISGFTTDTQGKNNTPVVILQIKQTHAHPDVDLNTVDDKGESITFDPQGKNMPRGAEKFWLTEDAEYRLIDFLTAQGIDTSGGQTYAVTLPQLTGKPVQFSVIQVPIQDDEAPGGMRMVANSKNLSVPKS